jgi:hypothetical protein
MKHSLTFDDISVTLDTGTLQTRKVKEPELVCNRLRLMGIESLKPFQARRMFEQGALFCDDKDITLTFDETSVTLDSNLGDFTRIVKNPKFVWSRLQALGIESLTPLKAKRLFDRGCSFYDTRQKLALLLKDGQPIRHVLPFKKEAYIREAVYSGGFLVYGDKAYPSLNSFVSAHYKAVHPSRTTGLAWQQCESFVDGHWVNLRHHYFHG